MKNGNQAAIELKEYLVNRLDAMAQQQWSPLLFQALATERRTAIPDKDRMIAALAAARETGIVEDWLKGEGPNEADVWSIMLEHYTR